MPKCLKYSGGIANYEARTYPGMKRKIIVAGNWKMNVSYDEALRLTGAFGKEVSSSNNMEVVVCPPAPYIPSIVQQFEMGNQNISVGGQNCHHEQKGAYTGEVSASMLASSGAKYVIIGHSERRAQFNERNELLNKKIGTALEAGLHVIYCVGETLEERRADHTLQVIKTQVTEGIANLTSQDLEKVVIAYEPVWAIGTGETASPAQAQEVHAYIRALIATYTSAEVAAFLSILYGGSMKPANARELIAQQDVDGGLVGGASLDEHQFIAIVRSAQSFL